MRGDYDPLGVNTTDRGFTCSQRNLVKANLGGQHGLREKSKNADPDHLTL